MAENNVRSRQCWVAEKFKGNRGILHCDQNRASTPTIIHMYSHMCIFNSRVGGCPAVIAALPVKRIGGHRRPLHVTAGANRSSNRTQWVAKDNAVQLVEHNDGPTAAPSRADPAARVDATAAALRDTFAEIDTLIAHNLQRVQRAFRAARVGPHHFAGSTGYGHGDLGRAALDEVRW